MIRYSKWLVTALSLLTFAFCNGQGATAVQCAEGSCPKYYWWPATITVSNVASVANFTTNIDADSQYYWDGGSPTVRGNQGISLSSGNSNTPIPLSKISARDKALVATATAGSSFTISLYIRSNDTAENTVNASCTIPAGATATISVNNTDPQNLDQTTCQWQLRGTPQ